MIHFITEPDIVGVISGPSTAHAKINKRPSHTFIYKINGESLYFLRGKQIHLSAGTILYIPENESYSFMKTSDGESLYHLVNFHADTESPTAPQLFSIPASGNIDILFKRMEKNWRFNQTLVGKYETLSMFYHLLAVISDSQQHEYTTSEMKERIAPAIDYLEKHIFDSDLKASILPSICNMSSPTFRRIFVSRFGVSPRKYIIHQRLLQAKVILESGEYENISDVAYSVGYDDPLYFSRHFKSFYGTCPSQF